MDIVLTTSSPRWLYRPVLCTDGNFHAEKMYMKKAANDVPLHDGEGFVVGSKRYKEHIEARKNDKQPVNFLFSTPRCMADSTQKSTCSNHKAVNLASAERKALLEVTGIGACACARHSFFVPGSVVDFQKGERQANIDYGLCSAVSLMPGIEKLLFCYDVGCQWGINFKTRLHVGQKYLPWPKIDLDVVVGKFHLGAHVEECFTKYSPNFVLGAGEINSENLEPLWSNLNKSFPAMRGMSDSYWRECMDWLMNESNWEKLISIGEQPGYE